MFSEIPISKDCAVVVAKFMFAIVKQERVCTV